MKPNDLTDSEKAQLFDEIRLLVLTHQAQDQQHPWRKYAYRWQRAFADEIIAVVLGVDNGNNR